MIPKTDWEPPIIIREAGTYKGNWRSTDGVTPPVQVSAGGKKVIIRDSKIAGNGDTLLQGWGDSNIDAQGCEFYGEQPAADTHWGKINVWGAQSFVFEHNYLEHTGGILVERWHGDLSAPLQVNYNSSLNIDGRLGSGVKNPNEHRAFVQVLNIVGQKNGRISWNQSINKFKESCVEDNISIINSGGAPGFLFLIHDNYIDGAFPFDPNQANFSGSGITVEGSPDIRDAATVSQYVKGWNNQVIRCANACMNINAGHDNLFTANTMVSSGKFPDGTDSKLFWGAYCIWDGSNVGPSAFYNNKIELNTIGYRRPGVNAGGTDRQDFVIDSATPAGAIKLEDNTHLPNPITKETEDAEWPKWQAKLKAAGITVGPGAGAVDPIPVDPVPADVITMTVGQEVEVTVKAVDEDGIEYPIAENKLTVVQTAGLAWKNNFLFVANMATDNCELTATLTTASGKKLTAKLVFMIKAADVPTDKEPTKLVLTAIVK